ncbi:hypothetical protein TNCV_5030881 [Trichonephila clavipes]|nr:hypothetical protein TNCV_5030881 [Trichonephila clavipes]
MSHRRCNTVRTMPRHAEYQIIDLILENITPFIKKCSPKFQKTCRMWLMGCNSSAKYASTCSTGFKSAPGSPWPSPEVFSRHLYFWQLISSFWYEDRYCKKIFLAKTTGNRSRDRPPLRWIDCVDKDLNILKVKNWKTVDKSRDAWRKLLKKTRAHPELSSY